MFIFFGVEPLIFVITVSSSSGIVEQIFIEAEVHEIDFIVNLL